MNHGSPVILANSVALENAFRVVACGFKPICSRSRTAPRHALNTNVSWARSFGSRYLTVSNPERDSSGAANAIKPKKIVKMMVAAGKNLNAQTVFVGAQFIAPPQREQGAINCAPTIGSVVAVRLVSSHLENTVLDGVLETPEIRVLNGVLAFTIQSTSSLIALYRAQSGRWLSPNPSRPGRTSRRRAWATR